MRDLPWWALIGIGALGTLAGLALCSLTFIILCLRAPHEDDEVWDNPDRERRRP